MKDINFERVMFVDGQAFIQASYDSVPLEVYYQSAQELIDEIIKEEILL